MPVLGDWDITDLDMCISPAMLANGDAPASFDEGTFPVFVPSGGQEIKAWLTDGAKYEDGQLLFPNTTSLLKVLNWKKIFTSTSNWTAEAWVETRKIQRLVSVIFSWQRFGVGTYEQLYAGIGEGDRQYLISFYSQLTGADCTALSHIIEPLDYVPSMHLVFRKTGATFDFFRDGVVEPYYGYQIPWTGGVLDIISPLIIGNYSMIDFATWMPDYPLNFRGGIQSVCFYNDAISEQRIADNYALGPTYGGLKGSLKKKQQSLLIIP